MDLVKLEVLYLCWTLSNYTKIETTKKDFRKYQNIMMNLTLAEGLPNHYEAVRGRLK